MNTSSREKVKWNTMLGFLFFGDIVCMKIFNWPRTKNVHTRRYFTVSPLKKLNGGIITGQERCNGSLWLLLNSTHFSFFPFHSRLTPVSSLSFSNFAAPFQEKRSLLCTQTYTFSTSAKCTVIILIHVGTSAFQTFFCFFCYTHNSSYTMYAGLVFSWSWLVVAYHGRLQLCGHQILSSYSTQSTFLFPFHKIYDKNELYRLIFRIPKNI